MTLQLLGCTHDSLGSYLKGLAVLRLVSQEDGQARGYWGPRSFVLDSAFDHSGLMQFFLERYRPTPALAPWNGGSGFYPKDRKIGINAMLGTTAQRFAAYRADLAKARKIVEQVGPREKEDERRTEILRLCRNELSDECVEWLDAAIAISSEESRAFAPILGTGGNEGRLDYTNNFMERLSELLIAPDKKTPVADLLSNALFGSFSAGLQSIAVGQYDPGRAGGFNQGEKIEVDAVANPWNAVLTLEGAAAWAGGLYRKQGVSYRSFLCSPFTVRPSPVGYGSASLNDEDSARAEIWTPLWTKPARFREIQGLLREGRAEVEGKPARNGLDFAQAAGMLGVDRGIDAFVRFSLLKRRGDSYIALRSGRFEAKYKNNADLIRQLAPFVEVAGRAARGAGGEVPNSWPPLQRAVDEAIFQALLHDGNDRLVEVAAAFGAMHRWLLRRKRDVVWPKKLSENWVRAVWFKPEARIAASLASVWSDDAGSLQDNLDPSGIRFSWTGRDLPSRMLATLRRRTLDGASGEPSPFASRLLASRTDVIDFLEQKRDEQLIENLTFTFLLAKSPDWDTLEHPRDTSSSASWLRWPAYCVLKQFFSERTHPMPNAPEDEPRFRPNLAIATWLQGGRVKEAMDKAIQRMRIEGLNPVVGQGWDSNDSIRLGAALLIPVEGVMVLRDAVTEVEEVEV